MNGLWKENLGGWNHKGSKRKKQTRKNTLRDRGRALLKIHYRGKKEVDVWEEGDVEEIKPEKKYQQNFYIEVWKIQVGVYWFDKGNHTRDAYYWKGKWYDDYTDEEIKSAEGFKKLHFLYGTELHLDEPIEVKDNNYYYFSRFGSKTTTFIYGKAVPHWKEMTFYNDGKRRKIAQKMVNKIDRAKVRAWINKGDWDAEIATHALSKSIAWEIH